MKLINQIVEHIVRPPREDYLPAHLGPSTITLPPSSSTSNAPPSLLCRRKDFTLRNVSNQLLAVSLFTLSPVPSRCILYLHGSSSCRLQALNYLTNIVSEGYNLCIFDFAGSGMSEGQQTTAGFREAEDIRIVVQYLVEKGVEEIVLWGRSMGAVAALIYASRGHPVVTGLVLDSPYLDLSQLITQKASEIAKIPSALVTPLLYCINSSLHQTANLNLQDLNLTTYLSSERLQHLPVLLVASKNDLIVGCHHAEQLHREYPCRNKDIIYIEQGHNSPRSGQTVKKIMERVGEWASIGKTSLTTLLGMTSRSNSYKFSLSGRGLTDRTI